MRPESMLLVEDNTDDVMLIRRVVNKAGIHNPLHVVNDGDAAVAYLSGGNGYGDRERFPIPAVVLLDLKLPRRSGLEVLAWVREHPQLSPLPVVVLTSSTESSDLKHAYELGANSYLRKPVHSEELLKMMQMVATYWLNMNQRAAIREGRLSGGASEA
jgi:CheY-like chemotaxis protein